MTYKRKETVRRGFLALALAIGLLTIVPAVSSLVMVSNASSKRTDFTSAGGSSVLLKNGETPDWIAAIIDRNKAAATHAALRGEPADAVDI